MLLGKAHEGGVGCGLVRRKAFVLPRASAASRIPQALTAWRRWCLTAPAVPLARPLLRVQDMQRPLYMQPADALAYGVIDGVVTPEKKVGARRAAPDACYACMRPGSTMPMGTAAAVDLSRARQLCRRAAGSALLLPCHAAIPLVFVDESHCNSLPLHLEQIIDDVKSADQWDKEAGLVAR